MTRSNLLKNLFELDALVVRGVGGVGGVGEDIIYIKIIAVDPAWYKRW